MRINFISLLLLTSISFAQVGVNTTTPDVSAVLDVVSTTQGMLSPRMTTAQRIATETDFVATGNIYITTPSETNITAADTPVKFAGTTTSTGLLRVSMPANNRLQYLGSKTRYFHYSASISVIGQASQNNKVHNYYIAKNGTIIPSSKQSRKIGTASDVGSISISGIVSMATNDYLEVWIENDDDDTNITALNLSFLIR